MKTRKQPMSFTGRDSTKEKENVQPLYLAKKNKGSKIGKGSFLECLEPSKYLIEEEEPLNVVNYEVPQVEEFELEEINLSVLGE